jgi:tRNA pseudouridine38-40 synthase
MRNLRLTVQYDGTGYVGWQRQRAAPSVQALLEDALSRIEGAAVVLHGAGRTDAGVHALGQVANVWLTVPIAPARLVRALNAVLPRDIRVRSAEEAPPSFHARFSAIGKIYEYRIVNAAVASPFVFRYAWHVPQPLELEAMRTAAGALVGAHDFASFQGSGGVVRSTNRVIRRIDWEHGSTPDVPVTIRIEGDGFLRHMVRNIVGSLVEVGAGRWPPARVGAALASGSRREVGPTAPPQGLFLVQVLY